MLHSSLKPSFHPKVYPSFFLCLSKLLMQTIFNIISLHLTKHDYTSWHHLYIFRFDYIPSWKMSTYCVPLSLKLRLTLRNIALKGLLSFSTMYPGWQVSYGHSCNHGKIEKLFLYKKIYALIYNIFLNHENKYIIKNRLKIDFSHLRKK